MSWASIIIPLNVVDIVTVPAWLVPRVQHVSCVCPLLVTIISHLEAKCQSTLGFESGQCSLSYMQRDGNALAMFHQFWLGALPSRIDERYCCLSEINKLNVVTHAVSNDAQRFLSRIVPKDDETILDFWTVVEDICQLQGITTLLQWEI
jgi:hypothetical protein